MPDGGTAAGGGMGGVLPLLLGSGGMGGGGGSGGGLSPLLLFLLLGQQQSCTSSSSSSSSDDTDPSTFADVLTANIGRRVKLIVGTNGTLGAEWQIIATIVAVNTDYVVLDNICVNGRPEPVLSRLNLLTSQILGIHRLTRVDEFLQLSCVLGSCFF